VHRHLHEYDLLVGVGSLSRDEYDLLVGVGSLSRDESSGLDRPNRVCVLARMNFLEEMYADHRNQRIPGRDLDQHDHAAR
jgi:hypothetical protein